MMETDTPTHRRSINVHLTYALVRRHPHRSVLKLLSVRMTSCEGGEKKE